MTELLVVFQEVQFRITVYGLVSSSDSFRKQTVTAQCYAKLYATN